MKNVLVINYTNIFSGAECVLHDYLLDNHMHNIYIYTNDNEKILKNYLKVLPKDKIYVSKKMNIVSIRRKPIVALKNIIYNLYKINSIVKKNKIDVLYGNNTLDTVYLTMYKIFFNKEIKIISHIHDILEQNFYRNYIRWSNKWIDKFIVPSIATKISLEKCNISEKKIDVVYNGIDIGKYNVIRKKNNIIQQKYNLLNKKIICIIGQICNRKRQDLFIKIINSLNKKRNNEYAGIIVGKVIEKDFFDKIKNEIKYPIIYIGEIKREELFENIYSNIDVLLLLSDRDPLPTVILESMMHSVIVVARNVDGVNEIIKDKENGFLFDYNVNIPRIVDMLYEVTMLSDEKKEEIINKAKKTINDKFSIKKKKNIINELIENL
ncbi:glycosyltransferase family 4 protein [Megamonas funiformis]|uniref:glycosyltransferase family 4 protein n=1 Tax=Megamonas funiformis TaxID=437897 RepID=UPI00351F8F4E